MNRDYWARLEDRNGRVVGEDPAWKPQRQFLWDVVHDTRGLLRGEAFYDDLELIRKIDHADDPADRSFQLDPRAVRLVFEKIWERAKGHDAKFRLVAEEGTDDWAAVKFFEEGGAEYALVGGWTGPFLRVIAPEPDQTTVAEGRVVVGSRKFTVKAVPYTEYFREDFESLDATLRRAEAAGLRVRFLQR